MEKKGFFIKDTKGQLFINGRQEKKPITLMPLTKKEQKQLDNLCNQFMKALNRNVY